MHPQVIDTTDKSGRRRPGPKAQGRICAAKDCDTRLSSYNPSETCSLHLGWMSGGVYLKTCADDLADLLAEEPCLD